MTASLKAIGSKPLPPGADAIASALNREVLPLVRAMRDYINGSEYTAAFGDGAATLFTFSHGLGTRALGVMVYDSASFAMLDITGLTVTLTDENTLDLAGFGAPPSAGGLTVVVKR